MLDIRAALGNELYTLMLEKKAMLKAKPYAVRNWEHMFKKVLLMHRTEHTLPTAAVHLKISGRL